MPLVRIAKVGPDRLLLSKERQAWGRGTHSCFQPVRATEVSCGLYSIHPFGR
jgi:hypothetical protein